MRPGNSERSKAEAGEASGAAAATEWEQLLEILRSADSPVGAAVHWVESHGGGDGVGRSAGGAGKRRKVCELWRFVPELLASEIVYVEEDEDESEEEREVDGAKATQRNGRRVGNCIWMQTLPNAMQTNILTFLNVEYLRFHAKDLEQLARCVLCSPDPGFWLFQAATTLLKTSQSLDHGGMTLPPISEDKFPMAGMEDYDPLPDWLDDYREDPHSSFSWLPFGQLSLSKDTQQIQLKDPKIEEQVLLQKLSQSESKLDDIPGSSHSLSNLNADIVGDGIGGVDVLKITSHEAAEEMFTLPAEDFETKDEQVEALNPNVKEMEMSGDGNQSAAEKEEMISRAELGDEVFLQAMSLRQSLRSCQGDGLPENVDLIRSTPQLSTFLSVVRAWEVDDEVTLLLVSSLLREQDGYAWSTQILRSVILPKLLDLEKPVSRLLITALAQAGKTHPRATMDAVLFPLICSKKGATSSQCEVINRMMKDSLPEEVNLSLCEKMFAPWVEKSYLSTSTASWVWTEGMITVLHNLLSQKLSLDQRTIAGLVSALDNAVTDFSTSLKFGNLLLSFFTKYAPKLKPHKAALQLLAGKSNTFLTKSLLAKLSAL